MNRNSLSRSSISSFEARDEEDIADSRTRNFAGTLKFSELNVIGENDLGNFTMFPEGVHHVVVRLAARQLSVASSHLISFDKIRLAWLILYNRP